jgi:predicted membrane-bound dolichyl-phosphate-mannose-protein mannosyltransferase
VGSALIAQDGPDRVLAPARLPLILLSGILGLLLFLWGRQIVGEIAALAAVFLYALDPTLLAHSFLATMDVGLAVFQPWRLQEPLNRAGAIRAPSASAGLDGVRIVRAFERVGDLGRNK